MKDKINKPAREKEGSRTGLSTIKGALVIGLTGGYGSGKSTVSKMFESFGAKTVSADGLVHEAFEKGSIVWERVAEEFGKDILKKGGEIDREKLGKIVFSDEEKRKLLESIVHPEVIKKLKYEAEVFRRAGKGVLLLEIPLLFEASLENIVDKIIVVRAEQETQITRLQKRYGISREEAFLRIKSQIPLEYKMKHADWIVSSECSIESTRVEASTIWLAIQKLLACE